MGIEFPPRDPSLTPSGFPHLLTQVLAAQPPFPLCNDFFHLFCRIAEAANYKSCLLSAASSLISLEVAPPPTLSQNLSGSPLVTVHLRHKLVS